MRCVFVVWCVCAFSVYRCVHTVDHRVSPTALRHIVVLKHPKYVLFVFFFVENPVLCFRASFLTLTSFFGVCGTQRTLWHMPAMLTVLLSGVVLQRLLRPVVMIV